MKLHSAVMVFTLLLAGCSTPQTDAVDYTITVPEVARDPGAVVVTVVKQPGTSRIDPVGPGCTVRFPITYPADVASHARRLTIREASGTVIYDDDWRFPLSSDRPYLNQNPDGTITWRGGGQAYGNCRPTDWVVTIGQCTSGDCPPMQFARSDRMDGIAVEVRRRE